MHKSRHPMDISSSITPEWAQAYPWTTELTDVWYNMYPDYTGKGYMKAAVNALIEGYMEPVMRLTRVGAVSRTGRLDMDQNLTLGPGSKCRSCRVTSYSKELPIRGTIQIRALQAECGSHTES